MPTIFLDIDGVLSREDAFNAKKQHTVETELLNNLKQVVRETGGHSLFEWAKRPRLEEEWPRSQFLGMRSGTETVRRR